jgi:hypothetical protein
MPHQHILSGVLALVATIAGLLAALHLRPVHGALAVGCLVILMVGAAFLAAIGDRMFDPLAPIIVATTSFAAASLARAAQRSSGRCGFVNVSLNIWHPRWWNALLPAHRCSN